LATLNFRTENINRKYGSDLDLCILNLHKSVFIKTPYFWAAVRLGVFSPMFFGNAIQGVSIEPEQGEIINRPIECGSI
jgi:hypothetical protein